VTKVKIAVASGKLPSDFGGAEAWMRISCESDHIELHVAGSSEQNKAWVECQAKEYRILNTPEFEHSFKAFEEVAEVSDAIIFNDICEICRINRALVSRLYRFAENTGKPVRLVMHEGEMAQCPAWLELARKDLTKIFIFDKNYKYIIPKDLHDKVDILPHPVPELSDQNTKKDQAILLLVRNGDFPYFEREIIKIANELKGYKIYVQGCYLKALDLIKKFALRNVQAVPPTSPKKLAQLASRCIVTFLMRKPAGTTRILFPTQMFECFSQNTPLVVPQQDFTSATTICREISSLIIDEPVITAEIVLEVVENPPKVSHLAKRYYKEYNVSNWVKKLIEKLNL